MKRRAGAWTFFAKANQTVHPFNFHEPINFSLEPGFLFTRLLTMQRIMTVLSK